MLRFFRKIRQKLLLQNQVVKYLLYAIGEIILVMIGILLALQGNNWNQKNQKEERILTYLENLKSDLYNDIERMEDMKVYQTFRYYSMQYLLRMAGIPEYNIAADGSSIIDWTENNPIWAGAIPIDYDSSFIQLAFL